MLPEEGTAPAVRDWKWATENMVQLKGIRDFLVTGAKEPSRPSVDRIGGGGEVQPFKPWCPSRCLGQGEE